MHPDPTDPSAARKPRSAASLGTLAAIASYLMWGLFPLYWKRLAAVEAWQILAHRILWAAAFSLLLLLVTGRVGSLLALARDGKRRSAALLSGLLITVNWGTYIWAVTTDHVAESALGYYINPLFSVALGAIFFREKLDRFTVAAVAIAGAGVVTASVMLGSPPWIALILASSFGLYGLAKKKSGLDPVAGLAAETFAVLPLALLFLAFRHANGEGALGGPDLTADLMLVFAGVVTAVPLLTFAYAANRITLQRLGFIQYISPTGQLVLGLLLYREELSPALLVAFATVIAAVVLYAATRARVAATRPPPP